MRTRVNHIFYAIIVLGVLSFLTFYRPLVSNRLFLYGDNVPQSLDIPNYTNMAMYVFNSKFIVGNPTFIAVNFVPFMFSKLIASGYLVGYKSVLWMLIPYSVFFMCVFLFFYLLESRKMPALGASLFFMFSIVNVHLLVGGSTGIYISLIGCFLFLISYTKFIQKPKTSYLVGMVFSSLIGFTNIAYFYTCLVVGLIFILVLVVQDRRFVKNNFVKYVLGCLFFIIFAVLINAYWLLPFKTTLITTVESPYGTLSDPISQAYYWTEPAKNLLYNYNFQWTQEFSKIYSFYNSSIYTFVSIFFLFITLRYFYILETKDSVSRRVFATFICTFILSLGTYLPFWPLFLKSIPGWFLLRSAPLRFYPFALLFFSWLVVRLLIADKKYYKTFFLIYIIFTGFVFFKADVFNTLRGIELPRDYTNVIGYLNSNEPSHSPVLVYPKMSYSNSYTWNDGRLIYFPLDMLSSNPIIKFAGTSESVPIPYRGMYEVDKNFSEIAYTASNLGVRFILLSNDIADKDLSFFASSNEFADRVYSGENLSLYKIKDSMYMPAITSTYAAEFWKINPTLYIFRTVISSDGAADVHLNLPFDRNWQLSLGDVEQIICDPVVVAPLYASTVCKNSPLVKSSVADYKSGMSPMQSSEGFNTWTLDKTLPVPNATSRTNADKVVWGVIEYGPQKYFAGGLFISGMAICIMALFIAMISLLTYVKLHILQL